MGYVTFIFALVLGIAAVWFSTKFITLYLRVKKWPKVEATVLSKEMFIQPKFSTSRSPYSIKASYQYCFNNTDYTGHIVYLTELVNAQTNHMKSTAEKRLDNIKDKMAVFVNPKDPNQSVIFCEGIGLYIFVFFMGLFSLLIALSKIL